MDNTSKAGLRVEVARLGSVADFPPLRAISMVRQLVVALNDDGLASPFLSRDVIKYLDSVRTLLLELGENGGKK